MNGYFKPLRRKIGVVTLLLACVFVAAWVRSYDEESANGVEFPFYDDRYNLLLLPEGIVLGKFVLELEENQQVLVLHDFFVIPHWSIVFPLTLLSAWLLLSKPRQPHFKPALEPNPETVA